ncbi:helix-turn-helix domain-containing protein [Methylobacterium sp. WL18]|uniref:helix-turn-helix domain-containing protein n=1 Tax=Methylobacterium sp. WL18 TaxID=2603897 RepID=UPI0011CC2A16|nr:helix-turn-helix domain-containing protein [Methylobacterium sp. WL18]TXN66389.1 helix-turn-helix domain-containing protein [Methylobacterium sp. WL18]
MSADDTTAEPGLPHFLLTTSGLPPGEAFERWRTLLAPMYAVSPATPSAPLPFGSNIAYPIDDLVAHRTRLSTQRLQRDRRRVEAGPDHYIVQLYRSGRFQGTVGGKPVSASAGTVTLIGRRHLLDGMLDRADAIGIAVPCTRLHGLPLEAHGLLFDAARNRLLAARISDIYRRLPTTRADEAPALADEFVAFLHRLLDPSPAADVLDGRELNGALLALARTIVQENLSRPMLSPEFIAGQMQVSRSTLYRLFEPEGGVMHFVQGERLAAVRDALADPMERRTISRLAEVFAFNTISQLSRSFRNRYGAPPQAWRGERRVAQRIGGQGTAQHVWKWLRET